VVGWVVEFEGGGGLDDSADGAIGLVGKHAGGTGGGDAGNTGGAEGELGYDPDAGDAR
jgi:hypothetical protein